MNTSTSVSSSSSTTETEILPFLVGYAHEQASSIALWRLPDNPVKHAILAQQYQSLEADAVLEELPSGFIMAPFDATSKRIFLPADYLFSFEKDRLKIPSGSAEESSFIWLQEKLKQSPKVCKIQFPAAPDLNENLRASYVQLVQKSMAEIETGALEKVVPSRTKYITLPDTFNAIEVFQKLCTIYPHALVSFVSIPGVGSWLGASPEVLVSVMGKRTFKTVALAGTKTYQEGTNLKNVSWTQKEIEEQALVERYIINCFKKIRLREYEEHGPKTVVAGNLMHLRSDFTVDMEATNFPQLGSVMLQLLHPTSAVCGMPMPAALDFLKKHEGYDRAYYSGYLGPVNFEEDIHLFVNLRCMQIFEKSAILYAGAGVTIDSIPENEWEETELKFQTMLNAIQS